MSNVKVEIKNLDTDEWQWLGRLSKEHLAAICALAAALCDIDTEPGKVEL